MISRKFCFMIIMLLMTGMVSGYVGTAPGLQDLGTLDRGDTYEAHFYILTDEPEPFLIRPEFTRAHTSVMTQEESQSYDFNPAEASEEDISEWISFSRDSYEVDPDDVQVIQLDDGGVARASQRVTYNIEVPDDAEPGYRMGAVELNPDFSPETDGPTSLQTVGVTQFNFVFRVPGNAERDLDILDVNSHRADDDRVRVDFLMENNGTVTTQIQTARTDIYDSVGNETGEVTVTGDRLAPGETRIVQTFWDNQEIIEPGEYRVEGQMNYLTGSSYVDSTIEVPEEIEIEVEDEPEADDLSIWLVLMVLMLIGAVMYYFEISPLWITVVLLVGGSVVAGTFLGVANYVMGTVFIISIIYLIYRWL